MTLVDLSFSMNRAWTVDCANVQGVACELRRAELSCTFGCVQSSKNDAKCVGCGPCLTSDWFQVAMTWMHRAMFRTGCETMVVCWGNWLCMVLKIKAREKGTCRHRCKAVHTSSPLLSNNSTRGGMHHDLVPHSLRRVHRCCFGTGSSSSRAGWVCRVMWHNVSEVIFMRHRSCVCRNAHLHALAESENHK